VTLPEWNAHFGFHLDSHGGPPYPHVQGYGVSGGLVETGNRVELDTNDIFWELVSKAYEIDGDNS
jgi:hypothetical protein